MNELIENRVREHHLYLADPQTDPFVIERANLLYLWDDRGNQYLDFTAGGRGQLSLGHIPSHIKSTVGEHLNHYNHLGAQGEFVQRWPTEYAKMLSESLPHVGGSPQRVMFTVDGEDALQTAEIMAKKITRHQPVNLRLVDPQGKPMSVSDVVDEFDQARDRGALVIVDERDLGFGRTGEFWSQTKWLVDADITVVGGAAGGGFPLGAVIAPAALWDQFSFMANPYAGNPVICSAGATVMSQITPEALAHITAAGSTLHDSLAELREQFPEVIAACRGVGLHQTIAFKNELLADQFHTAALAQGLFLRRPDGDVIHLTPPLLISHNELRRGVDLMAGACIDLVGV